MYDSTANVSQAPEYPNPLARAYRGVERRAQRERAAKQHASRELNYYYDEDGSLVIQARLPAEEGAVVLQAIRWTTALRSRD